MKRIPLLIVLIWLSGCLDEQLKEAGRADLEDALEKCGIENKDIRAGDKEQTWWVWYWSSNEEIYDDDIFCVTDLLEENGMTVDIVDREIVEKL